MTTIQKYLQQNDNKTLGSLLNKLTQLKRWNEILRTCLGDQGHIMDHCHIVNISMNSFIVIADSPNWVTRLRFYIPELLPKIRTYQGLEHIKAICCKAQPGVHHGKPKKALRSRLKLNSETADVLLNDAKNVKDTRIKAILEKIASHSKMTLTQE